MLLIFKPRLSLSIVRGVSMRLYRAGASALVLAVFFPLWPFVYDGEHTYGEVRSRALQTRRGVFEAAAAARGAR